MTRDVANLLSLMPDTPQWVEARDLILGEEFEAFGQPKGAALDIALRDPAEGTVFVIGRPADAEVLAAIQGNRGDLIAGAEHGDWLSVLLPDWSREIAIVHRGDRLTLALPEGETRIVDLAEIEASVDEPDLLEELRAAASFTEIAASFSEGRPVAFCYASAETETFWDVGIDTLEAFQRQGHARRVAGYMVRRMAEQNLETVWTALDSNTASLRLAESLGFRSVAEIVIFQRPQ